MKDSKGMITSNLVNPVRVVVIPLCEADTEGVWGKVETRMKE
jgi:hypothetical protein